MLTLGEYRGIFLQYPDPSGCYCRQFVNNIFGKYLNKIKRLLLTESQILVSSLPGSEETLVRFIGICVILYKIILYVEIKALLLVLALLCYSFSLYPKPYLDNSECCQTCSPLCGIHSPCLSKTTGSQGRSFPVSAFE